MTELLIALTTRTNQPYCAVQVSYSLDWEEKIDKVNADNLSFEYTTLPDSLVRPIGKQIILDESMSCFSTGTHELIYSFNVMYCIVHGGHLTHNHGHDSVYPRK